MKCFYHSADLDGHCSGAIVKRRYPDCDLIGINYGDEFPWDKIYDKEEVWMVDFSLQPFMRMIDLYDRSHLFWIDHHKSAIEDAEDANLPIGGIRNAGKAACELTWEYIYGTEPPDAVKWLGRYDVWDHTDPNVLPFQYGCRMRETLPENPDGMNFWHWLFGLNTAAEKILEEGAIALEYQKQSNEKMARARSFEATMDGLRLIVCNASLVNSQLFDSVYNPVRHDAMMTFCMLPSGRWTVSLYSTKKEVDVGVIAKAHGGGGHKGAAGFQCDDLPFEKKEN